MAAPASSPNGLALVTGFPGWLGNRLVRFLDERHPDLPEDAPAPSFSGVRALVLPSEDADAIEKRHPDVELVVGDVRDPAAVGRFLRGAEGATVFHLAGVIHPNKPRELIEINAEGTRHVLAAAAAAGVKRVVATSSNSPAGVSRDPNHVFDENSPDHPYMTYGKSKALMEQALRDAHAEGAVETVILRPCWFYGPDQPPRQSTFFKMIRDGKAPIVGSGEARRSMSYVDNTTLGLLLASRSDRAGGETYWIADERPYPINEIVDTVEELLRDEFGMPVKGGRMKLPSVASEVAFVGDAVLQRAGFYQQELHVLSEMNKTIACTIAKARDELGYRPGVELREGMRRSIQWCLDNGQEI